MRKDMRRFTPGKAAAGAALCAGLLAGAVAPLAAHAHILEKDEGEWLTLRHTLKGAHGHLFRVRRDSAEGRRALHAAEKAPQRRTTKARWAVAPAGPNSNCLAVRHWDLKGAPGPVLPGQKLMRCGGRAVCGAPLCTADMTCAGAVSQVPTN